MEYDSDSTANWNNTRTTFFTAGSHVGIMLSIFIGAIITAKSNSQEFSLMAGYAALESLNIYMTSSVIISFFSAAIASHSGGNRTICITGPAIGNIISILLIAVFISIMMDESFATVVEEIFTNSYILGTIFVQMCAALFGTLLVNIGRY
jgi:hypothetical protein